MREQYENPLCRRYASREMQEIFSDARKFSTWRKLWVALAESEKELGLDITDAQIAEMKAHLYDIDFAVADAREREVRHDVMAHIYAYGQVCPNAKPIIHLGATSCYVGDNTDLILQRDALLHIRSQLIHTIAALADFADRYRELPTLAWTHYQAAQPTTVGKRATLWMQDLMMDLDRLDFTLSRLRLHGCRGTTGTGASFLELFDGDADKVRELEKKIAAKLGFASVYPVSGQTYTRKVDYFTLSVLSGIAQSAMKFSGDIRLLSHMKEVDEPFESGQVGSSAMAYKRNPMRCERICSLSRYIMADALNAPMTASTQWFERTLDDSANRRISLPEGFLACDAVLRLMRNVTAGIHVNEKIVERTVLEYLPFIATENLLMSAVRKGGDRQELHEVIRTRSMEATARMKEGLNCDLLDRLALDPAFPLDREEITAVLDPAAFIGICPEQVEEFVAEARARIADCAAETGDVSINV